MSLYLLFYGECLWIFFFLGVFFWLVGWLILKYLKFIYLIYFT